MFLLVRIKNKNSNPKFSMNNRKIYIIIKSKTPLTKDLKAVDTNVLSLGVT